MGIEKLTSVLDEEVESVGFDVEAMLKSPVVVMSKRDNPANAIQNIEQLIYEFPLEIRKDVFKAVVEKHPNDEVHLHKRGALVTIRTKPSMGRERVPYFDTKEIVPQLKKSNAISSIEATRLSAVPEIDFDESDYEEYMEDVKNKGKKKKKKAS